jgi:hypothetical protein
MQPPINFPDLKSIIQLSTQQCKKIGSVVKTVMTEDALDGKLQGDPQKQNYKSEQYKRYKANGMRRFTFDVEKNPTGKNIFQKLDRGEAIRGSKLKKSGSRFTSGNARLKGYSGTSLNINVSSVNMILTQKTINSLHMSASDKSGITMSYGAFAAKLIEGNERHGYNIRTLSRENRELVKDAFVESFADNVKEIIKGKIDIRVSI